MITAIPPRVKNILRLKWTVPPNLSDLFPPVSLQPVIVTTTTSTTQTDSISNSNVRVADAIILADDQPVAYCKITDDTKKSIIFELNLNVLNKIFDITVLILNPEYNISSTDTTETFSTPPMAPSNSHIASSSRFSGNQLIYKEVVQIDTTNNPSSCQVKSKSAKIEPTFAWNNDLADGITNIDSSEIINTWKQFKPFYWDDLVVIQVTFDDDIIFSEIEQERIYVVDNILSCICSRFHGDWTGITRGSIKCNSNYVAPTVTAVTTVSPYTFPFIDYAAYLYVPIFSDGRCETPIVTQTTTSTLSDWYIEGITAPFADTLAHVEENNLFTVYWTLEGTPTGLPTGTRRIKLYKDSAHTIVVAEGTVMTGGLVTLTQRNNSGITGWVMLTYVNDETSGQLVTRPYYYPDISSATGYVINQTNVNYLTVSVPQYIPNAIRFRLYRVFIEDGTSLSVGLLSEEDAPLLSSEYPFTFAYHDTGLQTTIPEIPAAVPVNQFPTTRGYSQNCADMVIVIPCALDVLHGHGGTYDTYLANGTSPSTLGAKYSVHYFSPSGLAKGTHDPANLAYSGSITWTGSDPTTAKLVDTNHNWYSDASQLVGQFVLLDRQWTIKGNSENKLVLFDPNDNPMMAMGTNGISYCPPSDFNYKFFIQKITTNLSKPVVAASTTNIATLSGLMTLDGISLVNGNLVLVKDQTTQSQNGIYVVNGSGAWTLATFASDWDDLINLPLIIVSGGTTQAGTYWNFTGGHYGVVGTDPVTFSNYTPMLSNYLNSVTSYGTGDNCSFDSPPNNWTENEWGNNSYTLTIRTGYKITAANSDGSLTIPGAPQVTSAWYNISPIDNAINSSGTLSRTGTDVTVDVSAATIPPNWSAGTLIANNVTITDQSQNSYTGMVVTNAANSVTTYDLNSVLIPGACSISIDTCDPFIYLLSDLEEYESEAYILSNVDPEHYLTFGLSDQLLFCFQDPGYEEFISISGVVSAGATPLSYYVNINRNYLYSTTYPRVKHTQGAVAYPVFERGKRSAILSGTMNSKSFGWSLFGLTMNNCDITSSPGEFLLYPQITNSSGIRTVSLFKDSAGVNLVAQGTLTGDSLDSYSYWSYPVKLQSANSSGLFGEVFIQYVADDLVGVGKVLQLVPSYRQAHMMMTRSIRFTDPKCNGFLY